MSARLQGTQLAPQPPEVFETFQDIIDWKPAFQVIAIHAPIGLPSKPSPAGRSCDREARELLGWPRSAAIISPPVRAALHAKTYKGAVRANKRMNPVVWNHREHYIAVDNEMAPYWQRTIFEVNPELSFFNLNGEEPMAHSKRTPEGVEERKEVLSARLPGIERVYDERVPGAQPMHLIDAAANLWTARRILARAAIRIPQEPEWDDEGIRMEMWR
jgi:predicted RNase H-like nuclease